MGIYSHNLSGPHLGIYAPSLGVLPLGTYSQDLSGPHLGVYSSSLDKPENGWEQTTMTSVWGHKEEQEQANGHYEGDEYR